MRSAAHSGKRVCLGVIPAAGQRLINTLQHLRGPLIACAHHNAVGMQKILDRRAFAQKLGVRNHIKSLRLDAMAMQHAPNPVVGVHRNRALLHNHLVAGDGARNLRHHGFHVRQIRGAAVALRRAHGDKHRFALLHRLAQVRSENHRAAAVPGQQLRQMLLENGHAAVAKLFHLAFIVVHADHVVADLGKTGSRHKSHITRPDHTDGNWLAHALMFSPLRSSLFYIAPVSVLFLEFVTPTTLSS